LLVLKFSPSPKEKEQNKNNGKTMEKNGKIKEEMNYSMKKMKQLKTLRKRFFLKRK
jgi:hypothetical protein